LFVVLIVLGAGDEGHPAPDGRDHGTLCWLNALPVLDAGDGSRSDLYFWAQGGVWLFVVLTGFGAGDGGRPDPGGKNHETLCWLNTLTVFGAGDGSRSGSYFRTQ
jgi:hypothetical protein